jgi:hypothetical protein
MTRTTLLAGSALWILAATPALADGMDKRLTGLGDVGYYYNSFNIDNDPDDFDSDNFYGSGSALWTWKNGLNIQGNFNFNSDRYESDGGETATIDLWKLGGGAFWRDPKQGAVGGEVHYQSADLSGEYADGFSAAARGELYLPQITLAAHAGYSSFDRMTFELDGWQAGLAGTYYVLPHLAARLRGEYGSWDFDYLSEDVDDWSGYFELEYLIPDCTTSLYIGAGYGSYDFDVSDDVTYWSVGGGVRIHFANEGDLIQINRSEPLPTLRSRVLY